MGVYFLLFLLIAVFIALYRKIGRMEKILRVWQEQQEKTGLSSPVFPPVPPEIPEISSDAGITGGETVASAGQKDPDSGPGPELWPETAGERMPVSGDVSVPVPPPPGECGRLETLPDAGAGAVRAAAVSSEAAAEPAGGEAETGSGEIRSLSWRNVAAEPSATDTGSVPAEMPETDTPVPDVSASRPRKNVNYEKYIGENLFGKFGILVLVVGIGLFVKYAIDRNWIDETFRTILGFAAGSALLFVAERLHRKYRTFSSLLAGGAFAVFYVTVAVAFHYYALFSQTAAFAILVGVTLLMGVSAFLYDRRELAVIALLGGFIAPFLVSRGEGNYLVLFSYLAVLNAGMFGLSLIKKWAELPGIAFVCTYSIMLLYTWRIDPEAAVAAAGSVSSLSLRLFGFATLFFLIFLLPVAVILKSGPEGNGKPNGLLRGVIIGDNFIYLAFGLYYLSNIELPVRLNGVLTLSVAAVNLLLALWLKKQRPEARFLLYTLLGLVLTFVSLTIPIQLEGDRITLFWAAETVLLLWLFVRSKIPLFEIFSALLIGCTFVSGLMDMDFYAYHYYRVWNFGSYLLPPAEGTIGWNGPFATGIFTGLAFLASALLIGRHRLLFRSARILRPVPWNGILLALSVVWMYYYVVTEACRYLPAWTNVQAVFFITAASVFLLSYLFRRRLPIGKNLAGYFIALTIATGVCGLDAWVVAGRMPEGAGTWFLPWLTFLAAAGALFYVGKLYYACCDIRSSRATGFTWIIQVLAVGWWLAATARFLEQLELPDEQNAGISIALTLAGFAQMVVGMRLHVKTLRIISLATFGLVVVKLFVSDLWAMPTVGKILVFVLLGVILLVLSFLYQKLKDVLFKNNTDPE